MAQIRYMSLADPAILREFYTAGPRRMAYPATDRFVEAFGPEDHASWLRKRGIGGFSRSLELYVHTPFADGVCPSCGRHNAPSLSSETYSHYREYLERELRLQSACLDERTIVHLHWGGDTTALLRDGAISEISRNLERHFTQASRSGRSIEIDPLLAKVEWVSALPDAGVNQIYISIRECDACERGCASSEETVEATRRVIATARECGIDLIRMDVIFGLPGQTVMSFNQTLNKILGLSPQRVTLHDFAYSPSPVKGWQKIAVARSPVDDRQMQLFVVAVKRLSEAGYVHIGLNKFARPDDRLAIAQRQGRLQRNLQGYNTYADCDVLGMGLASVSSIGPTYSQNARSLEDYFGLLDAELPPVSRGIELTADDLVRRTVMNALMCHFEVAFESVEIAHLLDFKTYFAQELEELKSFADAGLVTLDDAWLCVTDRGRYVLWSICRIFDRYLRQGRRSASSGKLL